MPSHTCVNKHTHFSSIQKYTQVITKEISICKIFEHIFTYNPDVNDKKVGFTS